MSPREQNERRHLRLPIAWLTRCFTLTINLENDHNDHLNSVVRGYIENSLNEFKA